MILISFLGHCDRGRLANLNTAFAAQALIGLKRKGSPVLELKNIHRADFDAFFVSYAFIRIDFDFKHNMLFPGPGFSELDVKLSHANSSGASLFFDMNFKLFPEIGQKSEDNMRCFSGKGAIRGLSGQPNQGFHL